MHSRVGIIAKPVIFSVSAGATAPSPGPGLVKARPRTRRVGVLFGGGGVGSMGWARRDAEVGWVCDNWQVALASCAKNHPRARTRCCDLGSRKELRAAYRAMGKLDIMQVSPPCQWCSWAGKRDPNDPRALLSLVWAVELMWAEWLPTVIMMEQVEPFATTAVWAELQDILAPAYELQWAMVDASFLFPDKPRSRCCQRRTRFICVGVRRGSGVTTDFAARVARSRQGRRTRIVDAFPELQGRMWWSFARRSYQPCVLSVCGQAPPVRRNAHYFPKEGRYIARPGDEGPLEECMKLSTVQWAKVMGIHEHFVLPPSTKDAMLVLANGFVPAVAEVVFDSLTWPREEAAPGVAASYCSQTEGGVPVVRDPRRARRAHEGTDAALTLLAARMAARRAARIESYWAWASRSVSRPSFGLRWTPAESTRDAQARAGATAEKARAATTVWLGSRPAARRGVLRCACSTGSLEEARASWEDSEGCGWAQEDRSCSTVAGIRCAASVDPSLCVPAWFWDTAEGQARIRPQNAPALAAASAAGSATAAARAADCAYAIGALVEAWARDTATNAAASHSPAAEVALVASRVAQWARRAGEEAALHAFFDSGCFERFGQAYGEGPDPLLALDELCGRAERRADGRPGPWRVEHVARALRLEKDAVSHAAQGELSALPGSAKERREARWGALRGKLRPGCEFLREARMRLCGGVTSSGLPRRPVGGRFSQFAEEWARVSDDEEIRRWTRPVSEGGGITFDPNDDYVESNCAFNAAGGRVKGDGNGDGVLDNLEFVTNTIEEMIESKCALHLGPIDDPNTVVPRSVCPLGCAVKSSGKLRLFHDARKPNDGLDAGTLTLETLSKSRHAFQRGGYLVLADASAAYWHAALAWSASLLCGFAFRGHYFVWLVLPFGINLAPRVYCKLAMAVFTGWRRSVALPYSERTSPRRGGVGEGRAVDVQGRPSGWPEVRDGAEHGRGMTGISYIDDVALSPADRDTGRWWAVIALLQLVRLGFTNSWGKCEWEPVQAAKVLGTWVDLVKFEFSVVPKRVAAIEELCRLVAATAGAGHLMRTRTLAQLCGKIMSCYLSVGDPAYVMTKRMYAAIAVATGTPPNASRRMLKVAWDSFLRIPADVVAEAAFWEEMVSKIGASEISPSAIPARLVQVAGADTGELAVGGYMVDHDGGKQLLEFLQPLRDGESVWSSTRRELLGLARVLRELLHRMGSRPVLQPIMDTQCGVRALRRGSKRPEVHAAAVEVMKVAVNGGVRLRPVWLPRDFHEVAISDGIGKEEEMQRRQQDLQLDPTVFEAICEEWGRPSIDLFADGGNHQLARFYSRRFATGCVDADALAHDWGGEFGWAYPPFPLIADVLHHASVVCKARLILVVPEWPQAPWWPLVLAGETVRGRRVLQARRGLVRAQAGAVELPAANHNLVAVLLDFRGAGPRLASVARGAGGGQPSGGPRGAPKRRATSARNRARAAKRAATARAKAARGGTGGGQR